MRGAASLIAAWRTQRTLRCVNVRSFSANLSRTLERAITVNRPDLSMALRATTADENGEEAPAEHRSP